MLYQLGPLTGLVEAVSNAAVSVVVVVEVSGAGCTVVESVLVDLFSLPPEQLNAKAVKRDRHRTSATVWRDLFDILYDLDSNVTNKKPNSEIFYRAMPVNKKALYKQSLVFPLLLTKQHFILYLDFFAATEYTWGFSLYHSLVLRIHIEQCKFFQ